MCWLIGSAEGSNRAGIQAPVSGAGKRKFRGMTPITSCAVPVRVTDEPSTAASAPKDRVHKAWLRITTGADDGRSSSIVKGRPISIFNRRP